MAKGCKGSAWYWKVKGSNPCRRFIFCNFLSEKIDVTILWKWHGNDIKILLISNKILIFCQWHFHDIPWECNDIPIRIEVIFDQMWHKNVMSHHHRKFCLGYTRYDMKNSIPFHSFHEQSLRILSFVSLCSSMWRCWDPDPLHKTYEMRYELSWATL